MKNGNALFMLRVVQNADAMIHRILELSPSFDLLQDQVAYILATSRSTLQKRANHNINILFADWLTWP